MKPVDPPEEYGYPITYGEGQKEYQPLIARFSPQGAATTRWQLSNAERIAVANGRDIYLEVLTFHNSLQPVYLWVEGMEDV